MAASALARAGCRPALPGLTFATIPGPAPAALPAAPDLPLFTMTTIIDSLERAQLRRIPPFAAGDRVRVHFQVIEGTRRRTQVFEGVVIKRQGHGARETFTVRKQSFGVGVERTFPVHSPKIEKIEVAARGDVRRAKLYYLRDRVGKRARVRERRYTGPEAAVQAGLVEDPAEALVAQAAAESEAVDAEGVAAEDAVAVEEAVEAAEATEPTETEPAETEPAAEPDAAADTPAAASDAGAGDDASAEEASDEAADGDKA